MYVTATRADLAIVESRLEADIFRYRFGNSRTELAFAYRPYAENSVFLSCWTQSHSLAGTMRLTMGHNGPLKTLDDLGRPPWSLDPANVLRRAGLNPERCWDIATFSVQPWGGRSQGGNVAACLKRALYLWSALHNVQAWTAMVDDRVLRHLRGQGIPLRLLPGAFSAPYLGSPRTSPVFIAVGGLARRMERTAPRMHSALILGRGLEDLDLSALPPRYPSRAETLDRPRAA